jgi:hypothetical protein
MNNEYRDFVVKHVFRDIVKYRSMDPGQLSTMNHFLIMDSMHKGGMANEVMVVEDDVVVVPRFNKKL